MVMKWSKIRKWFVIWWLAVVFAGIFLLFWYNEWVYSLPTPVPKSYHKVTTGTFINITDEFRPDKTKPVFLHFFNLGCPCSRFNIAHFKSLVKRYGDKVSFAVVVMNKDKEYTVKEVQDKIGLTIPVLLDRSLADSCGVYSTPQAVIINTDHKLYYRGNYNKSRYCTNKNSNYAQMALDSLMTNHPHPVFNQYALTAYGCQLPQNIQ
jgi:hypothetical protein